MQSFFGAITEWMMEYKWGLIITLAVLIWLGLMIWFLVDASHGRVEGSAIQVGVGGLIGGAIVGLIASPIAGGAAFVALLLLNGLLRVLVAAALYLPLFAWIPVYAIWRTAIVMIQLLTLIPLFVLFIFTRAVQLWRGIFWTCPSRQCAYRGLPAHVCPKCGEIHDRLWPNLYGVLWHRCAKCSQRLPALRLLGRHQLERRCGNPECRMPLLGKHAGTAPERLVAIAGAPSSGKTNYLLMAAHQVIRGQSSGCSSIKGVIDVDEQEDQFKRELALLAKGQTPDATSAVPAAFLLYAKTARARCQLYLYDAPGEEFTTIVGISNQLYFHLLEGIILLVDPMSLGSTKSTGNKAVGKSTSLLDVVASLLNHAASVARSGTGSKLPMKVAVVISKADLPSVKADVGDVTREVVSGPICREAIASWNAENENALLGLENRFASVEYFACSALGRDPSASPGKAFEGHGVLDPLVWILTGARAS